GRDDDHHRRPADRAEDAAPACVELRAAGSEGQAVAGGQGGHDGRAGRTGAGGRIDLSSGGGAVRCAVRLFGPSHGHGRGALHAPQRPTALTGPFHSASGGASSPLAKRASLRSWPLYFLARSMRMRKTPSNCRTAPPSFFRISPITPFAGLRIS